MRACVFFTAMAISMAGFAASSILASGDGPLTETAALVFKGVTVAELRDYELWARVGGAWVGPAERGMVKGVAADYVPADGKNPARLTVSFNAHYDAQYQKTVVAELSDAPEGVAARILAARANPTTQTPPLGSDPFCGKVIPIARTDTEKGYGLQGLLALRDEPRPFTPRAKVITGPAAGMEAARAVIARFAGAKTAAKLKLERIPSEDGRPVYEILDDGRTIRASSPFAACRGFYDSVKSSGAGIRAWTGKRFDPTKWHSPDTRVSSPFKYRTYLNVVTYAYTATYWDEARWMEEIDWMALHGMDMPLVLMAYEAIYERALRRLGLTDAEIEAFFCGPAHLPFLRMGGLQGEPDRLNPKWRARSIRLQHAVMKRLKELGMTPICPAFGGSVPPGLKRARPEANLLSMRWEGYTSNILSPTEPLFREVERTFIEEWEKEFGTCQYYLADSFNEMKVPWKTEEDIVRNLAACGENIYGGMRDASPDATWVFQGWLFVNDPWFWNRPHLEALVSKVPDGKSMVIDLAVDYMKHFRKMEMNWDKFAGFPKQDWVYSYVPNMGGHTDFHFPFETYANHHFQALGSPNRGRLVAFGCAPEGVEIDEPMFELLLDVAWRTRPIEPMAWLKAYSVARYGSCPDALVNFWREMLAGPFTQLLGAPFGWQTLKKKMGGGGGGGDGWWTVNVGQWVRETSRAAEFFREAGRELGDSELYRADLILVEALADARLVEILFDIGRPRDACELLRKMDDSLAKHPLHRLDRWLEFARRAAEGDPQLEREYVENARRIVTSWGDPKSRHGRSLCDYSYRLWSGLIREWYLPRKEKP